MEYEHISFEDSIEHFAEELTEIVRILKVSMYSKNTLAETTKEGGFRINNKLELKSFLIKELNEVIDALEDI